MAKSKGIYEVRKLKAQKQKFIEGMIIFGHQRKAAEYASNCRGSSASSLAQSYLQDPWVRAELARRTEEALEKAKVKSNDVVLSAVRDILFNPKRLFDEKGQRKPLHELDEDTLLAIRVEEDKDGYLKIKSPDKAAAREQLMKHLGLFERDNEQKTPIGINVVHQPGFRSVEFEPIPLLRNKE